MYIYVGIKREKINCYGMSFKGVDESSAIILSVELRLQYVFYL